ncbi:Coenzyme F420 hydrogenase/dehydrogenase, beta subunit C-terminal domain [uncultured Litoreibacter sp.]|uniref:Coenzyme F420 hydrogenase/dehydrogenase, beta subunit C-terminal domain n=1 Tax=uncultured Litoreibacter sp. TaxID=1392394 RepID=UPI00261DF0CB|nr:Coenzyme F420 hydrogenase/dehydrogenase, beta subunit C-terminal domain [uncultured Litoreibacter sp.]
MARRLDVTDRIVAADLCAGCGACAVVAPDHVTMAKTDDGFLRPSATKLPRKQAHDIYAVCPGGRQRGTNGGVNTHPLWGGYHDVTKGWATNIALRHAAASGGALSGVLLWLIESGQVDGALHIAADPGNPTGNRNTISTSKADILAASASRYAPSAPITTVPELLATGRRYTFVGKPCDVAALRNLARLDARVDQVFPVMLSFFCAGVPSENGANVIINKLGVAADNVAQFRYRGQGWPGRATVVEQNGAERSMSYQESWGDVLSSHVQPRCRVCADGTGIAADIAFGDAWQTDESGYPLFEEGDGVSLILARTARGAGLVKEAVEHGMLQTQPVPIAVLEAMQPGQVRRRRELLGRLAGRVISGTPIPAYRAMGIWNCARRAGLWQSVRAALGMARRCFLRRRQQS